MVFHLGALWRLNELGYLPRLNRVSSVSGGSITAGLLGLRWRRLQFVKGSATNFVSEIAQPIRRMARTSIDIKAVIIGVLSPFDTVADRIAKAYRNHLFADSTLQDLPEERSGVAPRFVLNASNLQSGALWRFSRPYIWDYRVGKIENPTTSLATAVAASSAFPPFLSPVRLKLEERDFVPRSGMDLQHPPFTREAFLTDGGVYDNLGLETAWKRFRTVLVSDAGARITVAEEPRTDWIRQLLRVTSLLDSQVRARRRIQVINSYTAPETSLERRAGVYWSASTDIADYELATALPCPYEKTRRLAAEPTRLAAMDPVVLDRLINWGYAVCDAGIRRHVDPAAPRPAGFPYPDAGVG
jgi:NTE family protein